MDFARANATSFLKSDAMSVRLAIGITVSVLLVISIWAAARMKVSRFGRFFVSNVRLEASPLSRTLPFQDVFVLFWLLWFVGHEKGNSPIFPMSHVPGGTSNFDRAQMEGQLLLAIMELDSVLFQEDGSFDLPTVHFPSEKWVF